MLNAVWPGVPDQNLRSSIGPRLRVFVRGRTTRPAGPAEAPASAVDGLGVGGEGPAARAAGASAVGVGADRRLAALLDPVAGAAAGAGTVVVEAVERAVVVSQARLGDVVGAGVDRVGSGAQRL